MHNIAHFFIDGDKLKIDLPFNSKFIKHFRKSTYNTFIWNKLEKVYENKFSTYAFRCAVEDCSKFFEVSYCDKLKPLVEFANSIKNTIFEPTLVRKNGYYYISGINEALYEQIKNVELNDSMKCLNLCTLLGIHVHSDITTGDISKQFAASRVVSISKDMISDVCEWLSTLEIKNVIISPRFAAVYKEATHDLLQMITKYNIRVIRPQDRIKLSYAIQQEMIGKQYVYFSSKVEKNYAWNDVCTSDKIILPNF